MKSARSFVAAAALVSAMAVPGVAAAANAYSTGNVNLRAGPGTNYPVVVTVTAGAPVNLHGCLSGYNWCDISWGGTRGWVSGNFLETVYDDRRVLVPAYATRVDVPVISFSFGSYWDNNYRGRSFYRDRDRWDDRREVRRDRNRIDNARERLDTRLGNINERIDRARENNNGERVERLRDRRENARENFRERRGNVTCQPGGVRCNPS
jgi:uncharacterized protein YraI